MWSMRIASSIHHIYWTFLPSSLVNLCLCFFLSSFLFLTFIHFWETETGCESGRAEREGDTGSEAGFSIWAVRAEHDMELEPMNREIMTWAEIGHLIDWATQVPLSVFLYLVSVGVNHWVTVYPCLVSLSCFISTSEHKPFSKIFKAIFYDILLLLNSITLSSLLVSLFLCPFDIFMSPEEITL